MFMQMPPKPRFRDLFIQDLTNNFTLLSQNGTIQLNHYHLMTECIMYSCDMCLEFQRQSEGLLAMDWLEHIVKEVSEAIMIIYPNDFTMDDNANATERVKSIMMSPDTVIQSKVDKYYGRT